MNLDYRADLLLDELESQNPITRTAAKDAILEAFQEIVTELFEEQKYELCGES